MPRDQAPRRFRISGDLSVGHGEAASPFMVRIQHVDDAIDLTQHTPLS